MKGQAVPNHRRRKGKKVENNIDSATCNQTLNQQRQLHDRDHHVLINNNTEYQWTKLPHQKTPISKVD
jgi:phage anti-repressor protein